MKMHAETYIRLHRDCLALLARHGIPAARVDSTRHAWDVFAHAKGYWVYADGLTDAHIETALRRMFDIRS